MIHRSTALLFAQRARTRSDVTHNHNHLVRVDLNSQGPLELADTLAAIRVAQESAQREELERLQREVERLRAEFAVYITRARR